MTERMPPLTICFAMMGKTGTARAVVDAKAGIIQRGKFDAKQKYQTHPLPRNFHNFS